MAQAGVVPFEGWVGHRPLLVSLRGLSRVAEAASEWRFRDGRLCLPSYTMPKMIGAHKSRVKPGGFKAKTPKRENLKDVRDACATFFNKRVRLQSEWSGSLRR